MMTLLQHELTDFKVNAFQNNEFHEVTKDDVLGHWSLFFFYPADFTFVCPTELEDLAENYAKFKEIGCEIYSVSCDTHFVHKAWHDANEKIAKIAADKDEAIKGQDFEKAAELRDKQEKLEADRKQKEDSWREGESDVKMVVDEDVIAEVAPLFPGEYFHIGGDECPKTSWEKCPLCQKRMKKQRLANEEDLQGYFMKRISDYLRKKGREVIGWDELTNSSFLPEESIILGWQGMGTAALKAAEKGHRFIMTPARVLYLIRYQGPQWFEPVTYFGNNTLKDVFDYEPVQKDWKPEYESLLMGVQACMWTEFCNKPEDVDYLLFPRLAALAEVAWTPAGTKDWSGFLKRMDAYNAHIAEKGIVYARSMYNIQQTVTSVDGHLEVNLECIRPDVEIHYTLNGSNPAMSSHRYDGPIRVTKTQMVKAATFMNGKQMGETLDLQLTWNKATAKPLLGNKKNEMLLVNGLRGSLKYTDFEWCNWNQNDSISFTIDLQGREILNKFAIGCITNYGMGAHKPKMIRVEVSDDNRTYHTMGELNFSPEEIYLEGTFRNDYSIDMGGVSARYVRVTAEGAGICPDEHVRPGQEARVYFDEVIIE